MAREQLHCHLESLPPELIDSIFVHMDSIRSLHHFVITSPVIYQRFEKRKRRILLCVLQNELGAVLTDARFLYRFPYSDPRSSPSQTIAYWDHTHTMAVVYRDMLKTRGNETSPIPSMEELTQLCRTLHQINFLASVYFVAYQRWFSDDSPATSPLSRAERHRILRAFYRRQIISNAWAPARRREPSWMEQDLAAIANTNNHQGVRLGLFSAFEPWELQQIDHVDQFITRQCKELCLARDGTTGQITEAEFGEISSHMECLVYYMRQSPGATDTVRYTFESLSRLRSKAGDTASVYDEFAHRYLIICFQFAWQSHRFELFPDPVRDRREQQQESDSNVTVNFVGDSVDLPPFGWVDAMNGHYVNWFGDGLQDAARWAPVPDDEELYFFRYRRLRLWRGVGFALWDRSRVEALKNHGEMGFFRTGWVIN